MSADETAMSADETAMSADETAMGADSVDTVSPGGSVLRTV
jgi:hypothetical protein